MPWFELFLDGLFLFFFLSICTGVSNSWDFIFLLAGSISIFLYSEFSTNSEGSYSVSTICSSLVVPIKIKI